MRRYWQATVRQLAIASSQRSLRLCSGSGLWLATRRKLQRRRKTTVASVGGPAPAKAGLVIGPAPSAAPDALRLGAVFRKLHRLEASDCAYVRIACSGYSVSYAIQKSSQPSPRKGGLAAQRATWYGLSPSSPNSRSTHRSEPAAVPRSALRPRRSAHSAYRRRDRAGSWNWSRSRADRRQAGSRPVRRRPNGSSSWAARAAAGAEQVALLEHTGVGDGTGRRTQGIYRRGVEHQDAAVVIQVGRRTERGHAHAQDAGVPLRMSGAMPQPPTEVLMSRICPSVGAARVARGVTRSLRLISRPRGNTGTTSAAWPVSCGGSASGASGLAAGCSRQMQGHHRSSTFHCFRAGRRCCALAFAF